MSKLNVIVAVKDAAGDRLKSCLDSLINQTYEDMNVIVVDDCSKGNLADIIKEYADKYPSKIKAFCQDEEFGLGGAKNKGLIEADSEWIGFVNAMDLLDKNFYKALMDKAAETNADVVGCIAEFESNGEIVATEGLNPIDLGVPEEEMKEFLLINPGCLEAAVYKREIFDKNGLWFPTNLSFENLGILRLAMIHAKNYVFAEDVTYKVHVIEDKELADKLYDRIDVMTFFIEETYKRELINEYPEEIEEVYLEEMYINTLFSYMKAVPSNKWKLSFLNYLREGIMECFPEYDTNPYYWEKYDDEVKEMLELHCRNPKKFMSQYKSAWKGN